MEPAGETHKTDFDTLLGHPQKFIEELEELVESGSDDGDKWAELLYGDWFICPRRQLADSLEVCIARRGSLYFDRVKKPREIGIYVSNAMLGEDEGHEGRQVVFVPLGGIILDAVILERKFGGKKAAESILSAIEKTVAEAIGSAREELKKRRRPIW